MRPMPLMLTWDDVALRLALTVIAGALIGYNRDERGRPAGLRTTMLVCLAASVAMIQANIMLPLAGKAPDSFVVLDLMRLPLGILSGVGFLGAGAIVRRANLVHGVTTAATLWSVTVIGLCFGGGQISLGMIATALSLVALWWLKPVERHIRREQEASLVILTAAEGLATTDLRKRLEAAGFQIVGQAVTYFDAAQSSELRYDLSWRGTPSETHPPDWLKEIAGHSGVRKLQWQPKGSA